MRGLDTRAAHEVLVIGESIVDVVDRDGITTAHAGGSPLNVAYGLARLGLPTAFATEFGDDAYGRMIAAHLASAGVAIMRDDASSVETSVATAQIGADGSAHYTFSLHWDYAATAVPVTPVVHVGSVGAFREPGSTAVRHALQQLPASTLITMDPNIRPSLIPDAPRVLEQVASYAARADLVKLSDEDAAWLFPGASEDDVLEWFLDRGTSVVAITRGSAGSVLRSRRGRAEIEARPTTVVDTIGAGDAYMAGLIAAVLDGGDGLGAVRDGAESGFLERLGRVASTAAALTVARSGATPPTRAEMDAALSGAAQH